MATIVTFASGKGGVGKSVMVSNLGLALATMGRRVVLADLDVGGHNLATLFGAFESGPDLDAFFSREVPDLASAARPLRKNLSLIAGAGETLAFANPNWAMKQRLLRQLSTLPADLVLVDVGAGAGTHALDFFNAGDLRVLVTLPEPTSSVDAYRFLKLATVRAAATRVSSRNPDRRRLERRDYKEADEVWKTLALTSDVQSEATALSAPQIILNQASQSRRHFERLQIVTRRFLNADVNLLGEVPRDEGILNSVAKFLPIVEGDREASAARALVTVAKRLDAAATKVEAARRAEASTSDLPDLTGLAVSPA